MRTDHEDKNYTVPHPLQGRSEFINEFRNFELARAATLPPDEQAAQPTAAERTRLDEAQSDWDAARLAARQAGSAVGSALGALRSLDGTSLFRGVGGTYVERPNGSPAEIARAEASLAEARRVAAEAGDRERAAQQRFNETNRLVSAAGAARRRAVRGAADFDVWTARHPEASQHEVGVAREVYLGERSGLIDWVRVRLG